MLSTIKSYIENLPETDFFDFYQKYIFDVQDYNLQAEVNSIKSDDIISLDKFIDRLLHEVVGK